VEVVTNPERERVSLTMFFTLDPEKEIEGDRAGAGAGGRGEAQAVREDRGLRSAALGFKCKLSNPVTKCLITQQTLSPPLKHSVPCDMHFVNVNHCKS